MIPKVIEHQRARHDAGITVVSFQIAQTVDDVEPRGESEEDAKQGLLSNSMVE
jgi:hypothetical protein